MAALTLSHTKVAAVALVVIAICGGLLLHVSTEAVYQSVYFWAPHYPEIDRLDLESQLDKDQLATLAANVMDDSNRAQISVREQLRAIQALVFEVFGIL